MQYDADMKKLHLITNHPVHIHDENGSLSPSAFIPFCQFGSNISTLGTQTDLFKIPVCNSFQAKIFYDQLCYEIDVNKFIGRDHFSAKELKLGLTLLVDTNFNRQYSLKEKKTTLNHHHDTIGTRIQIIHHSDILHLIVDAILQTSNTQDIKIYIGTIGMYQLLF